MNRKQTMSVRSRVSNLSLCLLIVLSICIRCTGSVAICKGVKADVKMTALNKGFHRNLRIKIKFDAKAEVDQWPEGVCKMALQLHLPNGAYANPDELNDLRRIKKLSACPFGEVDTEKPAHMSSPIRIYIYPSFNSSDLSTNLPIHLRYHRAKENGGYERVTIKHPWVLLRCPANIFKKCSPYETISAPCGPCSPNNCQWHNITVVPVSKPVELLVPVGDLNMTSIITACTLLAAFGGCLFILLSTKSSNRKK